MTVHTLPPDPAFTNHTEQEVWERLRRHLPDGSILLANVRLTDDQQDHEADLVALIPDAGVIVVEVKGGSVHLDDQGRWLQTGGGGTRRIDPVGQSLRVKHHLRRYVTDDPRWAHSSRTPVRWLHTVVVPYSPVDEDFALPECPRAMIHGRDDQNRLAQRLTELARTHETRHRVPDSDDLALIAEILMGRNPMRPDVVAESDDREARATRLTDEQALILRVTRLLDRVEVRGGAGSGKTVLALTQARQLTTGFGDRKRQRVALLCYSIGLGEWFKRYFADVGRKATPAFIGRFEELGRSWGVEITAGRDQSDFWENELPERMAQRARELTDGQKFDAIIVDEAQDFADSWWTPLLAALRDPDRGGIYVYSDENQRLFPRFGRPPVSLVPLVLDHNLRNTRQIARTFGPLTPMKMRALGGDGPEVEFVQASGQDALDVAEEQVLRLLEEGWPSEHIALICTGSRHPQQRHLQQKLGEEGYWRTFWESRDVFYGHVLGCKGLERRVVVLCFNETGERDRAKERLYVGLSRATDKLVVVGDGAVLRGMAGPELAQRLGLG